MDATHLKIRLIYELENGAGRSQVLALVRLFNLDESEEIARNAVSRMTKENLLKEAVPIIELVSENYPMTTTQIIASRNIRPVNHSRKQAIGCLLSATGFHKVSMYRQGGSPTKGWAPKDLELSTKHRRDYWLSLLKNPSNIPDTPLNDLI